MVGGCNPLAGKGVSVGPLPAERGVDDQVDVAGGGAFPLHSHRLGTSLDLDSEVNREEGVAPIR